MKNGKNRGNDSLNFVYGRLSSLNCISNNKILNVYLQHNFSDKNIEEMLYKKHIEPKYVDLETLNRMSHGGNHQGIIVEIKPYEYSSLDEIIRGTKGKKQPLILILDEIEDPQNFGAILRSADAFSVDGVIVKSKNQVPLNWTVAKVSTGAIEYVKVARVTNISQTIDDLKEKGVWIYGADMNGEDYTKCDFSGPLALVIGNEGKGISRLVREKCDYIVSLPLKGKINSLNASVATGILAYKIAEKR